MADVRQLLRAERNSRRITHPHASYTSDGELLCNLCDTFVKSEAQWQSHLHSTGHNLRSQRKKDALETRGAGGMKRKADEDANTSAEGRKRSKAADEEIEQGGRESEMTERTRPSKSVKFSEVVAVNGDKDAQLPANGKVASPPQDPPSELPPSQKQETIDESEFLAFEREIASLSKDQPASALLSEATISAAPMTAQELASQASAEQSTQRGKRDAELDDEREDAARVLEDELEEMRGYEDRIKRLRERREELYRGSGINEEDRPEVAALGAEGIDEGGQLENGAVVESEDEDEGDFEDDWGFGGVG